MSNERASADPLEVMQASFAVLERAAALVSLSPADDVAELALMAKSVADRAQAEFVAAASRPGAPPLDRVFDSADAPLVVKLAILQAETGLAPEEALARLTAAKANATLAEMRAAMPPRL